MYLVPMEMPKFCNRCPFGSINYSFTLGSRSISSIDGAMNENGTYGYTCNMEFQENGRYTKVMRAKCGEDIPRPEWCGLCDHKQLSEWLQELLKLREQRAPRKPIAGADFMSGQDEEGNPIYITDYACAECGSGVAREYIVCPYCEQAIGWSDSE